MLLPARESRHALEAEAETFIHRFAAEHVDLRDTHDALRDAAAMLSTGHGPRDLTAERPVDHMLTERLLPNESAEEHQLYPARDRQPGSPEATETMSRAHAEIRLARRIGTHLRLVEDTGALQPEQSMNCAPPCRALTPDSGHGLCGCCQRS